MLSTSSASPPPFVKSVSLFDAFQTFIPVSLLTSNSLRFLTLLAVFAMMGVGFVAFTTRYQQARIYAGVIAIVIFIGVIALTSAQLHSPTSTAIKAGPDIAPQSVTFHQVTRDTVTITWHTNVPVVGGVRVSTDPGQENIHINLFGQSPTTDHLHRIPKIKPGQTYYFAILSNKQWFQDDSQILQYTVTNR